MGGSMDGKQDADGQRIERSTERTAIFQEAHKAQDRLGFLTSFLEALETPDQRERLIKDHLNDCLRAVREVSESLKRMVQSEQDKMR